MRAPLSDTAFPFVGDLTEAGRRELRGFPPGRAKPNQELLRRGARSAGAFLVVGGRLRVYSISAKGREATLYDVEPGGTCILALAAAFNDEPYPAWVQAGAEGATFVRLPNEVFRRLLGSEPAFRDFVLGVLSGRILDLMRALEESGSATLEQRVARYLLRRAGAGRVARLSQSAIAAELGTAREVVFRALRSLAGRRLIATGRLNVRILDPRALETFAEGAP